MSERQSVSSKLRRAVINRDEGRCLKCGRTNKLEVHHLFPVYLGGIDSASNLITLCKSCHKGVPDEPWECIKYISRHMSADMDRSRNLVKCFVGICLLTKEFDHITDMKEKLDLLNIKVDEMFEGFWKVFVSNDITLFGEYIKSILPKEASCQNSNKVK